MAKLLQYFKQYGTLSVSENVRVILAILLSLSAGVLPFYGAYHLWAWAMSQMTVGDYAGTFRVLTTLAMLLFGFTPTLVCGAGLFALAFTALVYAFGLRSRL
jgi:hypothetical protein